MISYINWFIIMFGTMISSFFIFAKSTQYISSSKQRVTIYVWCVVWALLFAIGPPLIPVYLACLTSFVFLCFLTKKKNETIISAYLVSFGVSWILYFIAGIIVGFPIMFFIDEHTYNTLNLNNPAYLLLYVAIAIVQFFLAFLLFRIRRFRKGFPFIFHRYTIVVALIFTGAVLFFVTFLNAATRADEPVHIRHFSYVIGVIVAGIGIYILIKKLITQYQNKRMQQNYDAHYEKLWLEEKAEKEKYQKQNKAQSAIIHNYADRISAIENKAMELGNIELLDDIRKLRSEYQSKLTMAKVLQRLPSTNVSAIDSLLQFFAKQFADDGIDFNVIVNGSIPYMVDNVVDQSKLETMIANHLKNAQISVNASDNPFRSIMAVIGIPEQCYLFTVFDSGIPFEVYTLEQFGMGRVTTHADTGGSGIGFETTFEIMREHRASLIISEQKPSREDYSKSVSIHFDGKGDYIIETYRTGDFAPSKRYSVVGYE